MNNFLSIYKKNKEIINYLIVGVLTTLVSILSYFLFTISILNPNNQIELQVANILSWVLAVIFAYFTNRKYVFVSNNKHKLEEFLKFTSSRITTLLIEMIFMYIFVCILLFNDKIMKIIAQIVVIVLNYILSKLFVFKKDKV